MEQSTPHNPITSKDNSIVKYLRSLQNPKQRKKEKAFLIEGVRMVEEALRENLGVRSVVAAQSLVRHHGKGVIKLAENRSVNVIWISDKLMESLSESKTPQPVMAVAAVKEHTEDEIIASRPALVVVANQLQDPGNLGTIIRTAEAAGASGVVTGPRTVDPYNAKAVRASMGSILRLPVVFAADIRAFLDACSKACFQTIVTALTGERTHFDIDLKKPTVVLLGQEGAGLPKDLMEDVDYRVRIPMTETVESLNVATAAAVILYEAMRQRMRG